MEDDLNKVSNVLIKKKFNDIKNKIKSNSINSRLSKNDTMLQIYKYRKVGFSFSAIAPVMKITENKAEQYYNEFLKNSSEKLKNEIIGNNLNDLSDIISELEYLKELAYSNQMASEEGSVSSIASLKLISEIVKEISEIKMIAYARKDDI